MNLKACGFNNCLNSTPDRDVLLNLKINSVFIAGSIISVRKPSLSFQGGASMLRRDHFVTKSAVAQNVGLSNEYSRFDVIQRVALWKSISSSLISGASWRHEALEKPRDFT
ncbi:hypothetical protein XENOCAPTIV_003385 [Xenoophorus captivus]|uniref:Uncharacterized protein n=1 Tax=Xenoophorus captivus TaxID=1517983 RepID=A0ABV0RAW1_9TELE